MSWNHCASSSLESMPSEKAKSALAKYASAHHSSKDFDRKGSLLDRKVSIGTVPRRLSGGRRSAGSTECSAESDWNAAPSTMMRSAPSDLSSYQVMAPWRSNATAGSAESAATSPASTNIFSGASSEVGARVSLPHTAHKSNGSHGSSNVTGGLMSGLSSLVSASSGRSARSTTSMARRIRNKKSLDLSISEDLLRGASLKEVLRCGGRHLKPGLQSFASDELYSLSQKLQTIDAFYSHCWLDGRWTKFVAICFTHNGDQAFLATIVWSMLVFMLQIRGILPLLWRKSWSTPGANDLDLDVGCWCFFSSPFVYVIILLWWQSIAERFRRPFYVFLDKLCIHQTDDHLRCLGILGIGGILNSSEKMIVLWSPKYFYRLWCIFEVAVWCALNRSDSLQIVPLAKVVLQLVSMLLLYAALATVFFLSEVLKSNDASWMALANGIGSVCLTVVIHFVRGVMRELQGFEDQLSRASIKDAECFCCTHVHKHPVTGEKMNCDRTLVMNTIDLLFPNGGGVDALDLKFRQEWKTHVTRTLGGFYSIHFRACLVMVAPMIWLSFDILSSPTLVDIQLFRVFITRVVLIFDGIIWIRMLVYICGLFSTRREFFLIDVAVSWIGAAASHLTGAILYWLASKGAQLESYLPQLGHFALATVICACMWCQCPSRSRFAAVSPNVNGADRKSDPNIGSSRVAPDKYGRFASEGKAIQSVTFSDLVTCTESS